jgi:hypothetical protein
MQVNFDTLRSLNNNRKFAEMEMLIQQLLPTIPPDSLEVFGLKYYLGTAFRGLRKLSEAEAILTEVIEGRQNPMHIFGKPLR